MRHLVRTELLKQRTTRTIVFGIVLGPVVAVLVTVAVLGAAGTQGNDPLGPDSLVQSLGAPASVITAIALVLGLLGMAGEYRHQTITTTFLASPRRSEVVVAKLVAYALAGTVLAVLSLVASAAVAVPWLQSSGVAQHVDADALRVATGSIASSALYGALGVAIGALVRNQTVAVSAVFVWLLAVEGLIANVVGGSAVVRWLPVAAGRALVDAGSGGDSLTTPMAAAVLSAYVAAFALAGARITIRRDIT